jgi:hypothetical protein
MGTAVLPAKTSPASWDAFADVDAFVDGFCQLSGQNTIACMSGTSRKPNILCFCPESWQNLFHTLKTELVHHRDYLTRDEARRDIFEYIEVFYNRQRRHSTLGYLSPA